MRLNTGTLLYTPEYDGIIKRFVVMLWSNSIILEPNLALQKLLTQPGFYAVSLGSLSRCR